MLNLDPDLRTLQIAAAVAETGSMLEASRRFAMTQSAVSQAVRRAEQAIGVEFFDRSRRPLTMTRAGRVLSARVADLNREFDTLLVDLRAAAALPERRPEAWSCRLLCRHGRGISRQGARDGRDGAEPVRLVRASSVACGSADAP